MCDEVFSGVDGLEEEEEVREGVGEGVDAEEGVCFFSRSHFSFCACL